MPALVLYQLVLVNYGEFASAEDAETFGAAVLGISRDEYYQTLCEMADQLRRPGFHVLTMWFNPCQNGHRPLPLPRN